jgi:hypothetical protein
MSKHVQSDPDPNVPTDLNSKLEARSAMASMSLSDYLLIEIKQIAVQRTLEEMRARLARVFLRPTRMSHQLTPYVRSVTVGDSSGCLGSL